MGQTYVIVAETRGGKLRQVTFEAIQAAQAAFVDGDRLVAVILGHRITAFAEELALYGLNQVIAVDSAELERYCAEAYFSALRGILNDLKPDAVFLGHTSFGRDLAPMAAAYLGAGQISDTVKLEKESAGAGGLTFTRPIYAGKAFEKKRFVEGPFVVTIRPNNIPAAEPSDSGSPAPIVQVPYTVAADLRTIVKDVLHKASEKLDLTEAKIIVSGGRGVKSAEGFRVLEELAEVLNAAVGASRGACDAGYCDYALQIGQTGKVVTPEVYIACGISGAIQHLAGMSQSRLIIAINKDPEAPIFKVADFGVVGDLFEVVPLLTEEFKKIVG